jgi:hypothetical protein
MIIDIDYKQVEVPYQIVEYCDYFTYDAKREDLRYIDCVYMNMGYYGNDPEHLEEMRKRIMPAFE